MWKIKTVSTRNNIVEYWKLSIGMCQSFLSFDNCDESDGIVACSVRSNCVLYLVVASIVVPSYLVSSGPYLMVDRSRLIVKVIIRVV